MNAPTGKGVTAMAGLTTGFQLSRQQAEMLDELKAYLDENFSPEHECHDGTPEWGSEEEFQWYREFNRKLFEDGWLCPQWPQKYGGRGLTPVDQMLIKEEFAYRRVGLCNANGLQMLSPILLTYGSEEQKDTASGQDRPDGGNVVPGLLRAGVRLGSDPSAHHGDP